LIAITAFSRSQIATVVALIFHLVGITGILFFNRDFFVSLTSFNLLLSAALLTWSQPNKNGAFYFFNIVCYVVGFFVEYLGVNHGLLFGEYKYGSALGLSWQNVPLIIGVNWMIVMLCSGISVQIVLNAIWNKLKEADQPVRKDVGFAAIVIDGALLATFFDWVIEPVAVKLGYWQWLGDGSIPAYNYVCWFGVSAVLLLLFRLLKFEKSNQFALNLLLIQLMFFLILRTVL
jgi:bisanhydrobacterioruberin hydratase